MKRVSFAIAVGLSAFAAFPTAGKAQGVARGADDGAAAGQRVGGPVGGVVGSVIGGVVGGVNGAVDGVLGRDTRPRFRDYVVRERHPSYAYSEDLRVGTILPDEGVSYYEVPREYGVSGYRYTIINGRTVLVDPATRRVLELMD